MKKIAILISLFGILFIAQAMSFVRARASASRTPSSVVTPASMNNTLAARRAMTFIRSMTSPTFIVTTTADFGDDSSPTPGSLRAAIVNANGAGGGAISFNLPGSGVQTIMPVTRPLPDITAPVVIDGYTQPGASANTAASGDNAVLLIELNGGGISNSILGKDGLSISAPSCTVRGLVLNGFHGNAIALHESVAANNVIEGNFIGTDPTGTAEVGNFVGVYFLRANGNRIGGATPAARNLISGNSNVGIDIANGGGATGTGNVIQGNYVGTNAAGTAALPNTFGILIDSGQDNLIGGTTPGAGNLVSGNVNSGIRIASTFPAASGNVIQGNFVGTDVTGLVALGNGLGVDITTVQGGPPAINNTIGGTSSAARNVIVANGESTTHAGGIRLFSDSNTVQGNLIGVGVDGTTALGNHGPGIEIAGNNNLIGGASAGAGNVIAYSGRLGQSDRGEGVFVTNGYTGNAINGNSIFANGNSNFPLSDRGIALSNNGGATPPNDDCDADTGANNLQNFPVLTAATSDGTTTTIEGTLNSTSISSFRIEFFANDSCHPSGYGEGKTFLGAATMLSNGNCAADFTGASAVVFPVAVTAGQVITSTATALDSSGNPRDTSEFSACIGVTVTTPTCTFSINPSSQNFPAGNVDGAGTGSVNVTAPNGCGWTTINDIPWVKITSGAIGSGNGTVNYSVARNTGPARSATMTIAGQTFTITQDGSGNTPAGSTVSVQAADGVTVFFTNVSAAGNTIASPSPPPIMPSGFAAFRNLAFDIQTTATVSGPITVTFDLARFSPSPPPISPQLFSTLRVLHTENGVLVDRTSPSPPPIIPAPPPITPIFAGVNSLGQFAVAQTVNTTVGSHVSVQAADGVTIFFTNVSAPGYTVANPQPPPIVPSGFSVFNNLAFDISTTATFSGPVIVTLDLSRLGPSPPPITPQLFSTLRVFHSENGVLVDRTTPNPPPIMPVPPPITPIFAGVNSLGQFTVAQTVNTPVGSNVSVQAADGITIFFTSVSAPGYTVASPQPPPIMPQGFAAFGNLAFNIQTTAMVTGSIIVTLDLSRLTPQPPPITPQLFSTLRVFHSENGVQVDRTSPNPPPIMPSPPPITPIFANVNSLGSLVIGQMINTPTGSNVSVQPADGVTVFFSDVSAPGNTVATPGPPPIMPPGLAAFRNLAFNIQTTATVTGPVIVTLDLSRLLPTPPPITPQLFSTLRVLHVENGVLVDRTQPSPPPILPQPPPILPIFAGANSLGQFVVAQIINTPAGSNVSVQVGGINVFFPNVSAPGNTVAQPVPPPIVPPGFAVFNNLAFDISTTAGASGPAIVTFDLSRLMPAPPPITPQLLSTLRVLHAENGVLVDRTLPNPPPIMPTPPPITPIFANVSSLGQFVIAQLVYNTPAGSNVSVQLGGINVFFTSVSAPGNTVAQPTPPPIMPSGFSVFNNLAFDISTTATVSGPITVTFDLAGLTPNPPPISPQLFSTLRVLHGENGVLVNRTQPNPPPVVPQPPPIVPIYGGVNSLSPFVIARMADTLVFSSSRDGNLEIYTMNSDGTNQMRLTNNPAIDAFPAWSPDHSKIAFTSNRNGLLNFEVYAMNADGSSPVRLTTNAGVDGAPAWSPDGTKIAFTSSRDGNFEIYVMNSNGSGLKRLTSNAAVDSKPTWSPDGTKIAFNSNRDGNFEIYVMNADGTGQKRLTSHPASDISPAWSPDGTKIAFASNRDGLLNFEVYVMNVDGTGLTRLITNSAVDGEPAWSPDGAKIVFSSNRDGLLNFEIYLMNREGTGLKRLTTNSAVDASPSW